MPQVPTLHLDGFNGPMDLLLDLAERQRNDLRRMSVLDLVEQFVAVINRLAGRVTLKRRAEWLVLATLLRMRAMAAWLEARPQLGRDVFGRGQPKAKAHTGSTMALMEACLVALRGRGTGRKRHWSTGRQVIRLWRVEQALARIRQKLAEAPQGG